MKTSAIVKIKLDLPFFRHFCPSFTLILTLLFSCFPVEGVLARNAGPAASRDVESPVTCGGLRQRTQGMITSPHFLRVFAEPERVCHWIIQGGQRQQISLFIAELYAKHPAGIAVTAHDTLPFWLLGDAHHPAPEDQKNGTSLGFFSLDATPDVPIIRTTKTYMVVSSFPGNGSTANQDPNYSSFLHVTGFNLTYEISPLAPEIVSDQSVKTGEDWMCSFRTCRFLGRCLVDANLTNSWCQCRPGHSGDRCQFGPDCDPSVGPPINPCANGTGCEYSKPNSVFCKCPPHLTGDRCDTWRTNCTAMDCEDHCLVESNGRAQCRCLPGRRLASDGRTCSTITAREAVPSPPPCRYHLREPRGLIQTPNFPASFRTPIDCEWVLEVGPARDTLIYFTEIYLAHPALVRMTAYDTYENGQGTGETRLGTPKWDYQFDFEKYPDGLSVNQSFVVIRMQLNSSYSMVRVKNYVLNDFGFNMTYVTYPVGSTPATRLQGCMGPFACRFAGRCTVNEDYTSASCVCYQGQFGDACEYGPKCNPLASPPENPCLNGGSCHYTLGTEIVQCDCPSGFGGARCEQVMLQMPVAGCEGKNLACQQRCLKSGEGMKCACHPGFRIDARDNRTCLDTGRKAVRMDVQLKRGATLSGLFVALLAKLAAFSPQLDACRPLQTTRANISIVCSADDVILKVLEEDAPKRARGRIFNDLQIWNVTIRAFPLLDLLNLTFFSPVPAVEKSEIALVCLAQGSSRLSFSWAKDGVSFDPSRTPGMWMTQMTLRPGLKSCQVNIENVRRAHQGVYTCTVEDQGALLSQSRSMEVLRPPTIIVLPSTPTVNKGEPLAITCMTPQFATYRWHRRTEDVKHISGHHLISVLPSVKGGVQLFIDHVDENTEYTCTATNAAEKRERVIKVRVLLPNDPVCRAEDHRGITWGLSLADTENEQLCPYNMSGAARRRCGKNAQWLEPDFSDCISLQILAIRTQVDGMQVGFGNRDLAILKKTARDVDAFVVSQRPLFSRDLSTAVDLLDMLRSMALEADLQDVSLKSSLSATMQLLLSEMDVLPTNILSRFSLPHIEKNSQNELLRRVYSIYGKFPCHVIARKEILINETLFPRYQLHCPVISPSTSPMAPVWAGNFTFSLQMYNWSSSNDLLLPEVTATVSEKAEEKAADSRIRMAANVMDLVLHKFDPVQSSYLAHLVFDLNSSDLLDSESHKFFSEPSVIHETVACVQKTASSAEWSSADCETQVQGTANSSAAPAVVAVHCLCRLSSEHSRYGIRMTDNSTSYFDPLRFLSTSPSYVVPVIIIATIVFLLLVCVGLFCWQRKKNFRTSPDEETVPAENIPMNVSGKRLSDGTGTAHPEEVASLVLPQ